MIVDLDQPEWNQLLAILAQAPWATANPIIMKIGAQLQAAGHQAARQGRGNGADPGGEDPPVAEGRQRPS